MDREKLLFTDGCEWKEDGESASLPGGEYFIHLLKDTGGRRCISKKPRFEGGGVLLEREGLILQWLSGKFSFSIPVPDVVSQEGMVYELLPGKSAIEVGALGEPRWNVNGMSPVFVDSLAFALVQIHGARVAEGAFSFDHDHMDLKTRFLDLLEGVREYPNWRKWSDWAEETVWPDSPSFIHGDMHAGNILVNGYGVVTGVIDWTHAGMGDPCQDFVFHYFGFGERGLDQLLESYERQGGSVFPGMKEHVMGLWDAYLVRKTWLDGLQTGVEGMICW